MWRVSTHRNCSEASNVFSVCYPPVDPNSDGDIYPNRWPTDDPLIIWAFGLPFVPAYGDHYILAGPYLRNYLWILDKRDVYHQLKHAEFHLGDIISPRGKFKPINANGTVDRLRELRLVQIRERSQLAM
ncbi:unnamed protein product [Penicillium camemberti]|uniref:Str. FM013 n=1 Tax=Penicillium camemberti (strain FM 013) TaxID=1429867 RepID=A0A0G4PE83_PENC3|nr:unnamed protein product [Penicillium camemberti]